MKQDAFQSKWEELYSEGKHLNRYPWDMLVSFVYRNAPKDKPRNKIKILEVGCGTGSNLWFAAREGFCVAGIDGSESAINYVRERFTKEGLEGDFKVGDFTRLPFEANSFDIVIDRAAITCCNFYTMNGVIKEINRVLAPGGKFFFNPYSDRHSSFVAGKLLDDGLTSDISKGTLVGIGNLYFINKREIFSLFADRWKLIRIEHSEIRDELNPDGAVHADWRVVAEKK